MKKKIIFCCYAALAIMFCENKIVNADEAYFDVVDCGEFNNGIAPILFQEDSMFYKGYINKEGSVQFFVEQNDISYDMETSGEGFEYYNRAEFDNGYSWFELNGLRYVINESGEITSSYYADEIVCDGAGYTWVLRESEGSWNSEGGYTYILYDPNGIEETRLDYSIELENPINYLGNGAFYFFEPNRMMGDFADQYRFYFTKSKKWINEGLYLTNGNPCFNGGYLAVSDSIMLDDVGNIYRFNVPDDYTDGVTGVDVVGNNDKYILYAQNETTIFVYNIMEKEFARYTGEYVEYIWSESSASYTPISNMQLYQNYCALRMRGADGESYIGLIDLDTMEEIGDPIRGNGFLFKDGFLAVYNEWEYNAMLYDTQLNMINSFGEDTMIKSINEGIIVERKFSERGESYNNPDGTLLFDDVYDFSNAKCLSDGIEENIGGYYDASIEGTIDYAGYYINGTDEYSSEIYMTQEGNYVSYEWYTNGECQYAEYDLPISGDGSVWGTYWIFCIDSEGVLTAFPYVDGSIGETDEWIFWKQR